MGWETLIFAALTGLKAVSQMNAATKQAENAAREGNIVAKEKAKEIRYKVARQTSSFLNSGLTLEGTPQDVIGETFSTGLDDIKNIRAGYNAKSKNFISQGRSEAIGTIASGFGAAAGGNALGSAGSMFESHLPTAVGSYLPDSELFKMNSNGYGSSAYDFFDAKDARG